MKKAVLLLIVSNVGLFGQFSGANQQALLVTHVYGVTSSWAGECGPKVLDNRSLISRRLNYHAVTATGSGSWSVALNFSDAACTGPWTSFGTMAAIDQTTTIPIASGFGYHPFIQIVVTGTATATYSGERDLFIQGGGSGGGGGVSFPILVTQGGTGSGTAAGARASLGAAASGSNADITALTALVTPLSPSVIPAINLAGSGVGGVFGTLPNNKVAGLAASATTDTTNASNITSGTLGCALLPAFSGDATNTACALALATVNSSPGACGDSGHFCVPTINGKGLVTAQSTFAIPVISSGLDQTVAIYNGAGTALKSAGIKFGAGASIPFARVAVSTGTFGVGNCAIYDVNGNLDGSAVPIIGLSGTCARVSGSPTPGNITQFLDGVQIVDSGFAFPLTQTAVNAANRQGNGTKFLMGGTIAGTGAGLCTDVNGNATTVGCASGVVSSVFGRTGVVTAQTGDYGAAQITGLAASATTDTTNAANITSGMLALARGGTHANLSATGGASQVLKQVSVGADITVGQLAAADISGLAASATTDTTNASNISSGTLNAARLPASVVLNNASNAYSTGNQDFTNATSLKVPNSAGAAPTISGLLAYDTTANRFKGGQSGNTINLTYFVGTLPTTGNCVQWSSNGAQSDTGAPCGTGGSGAVSSVFTRTGAITAQVGDYSAGQITGLAASATTDTTNASNITSGTLGAARLPNPTTSTLGGIQAFVAVNHQWIRAISALGVPSASQPDASDITGLAGSATTDTTNANNITSGLLALARGGTHADLSATGGAHQVLRQSSVGANITVSQLAAGDISGLAASATTDTTNAGNITSGTLAAARLPNPTVSTIGGVEATDCVTVIGNNGGALRSTNTDGTITCGQYFNAIANDTNVTGTSITPNEIQLAWVGTLAVSRGGWGLSTLTPHLLYVGNGTTAPNSVAIGTAGQVLTSNGAGVDPTFQAAAGGSAFGTVCNGTVTATAGQTTVASGCTLSSSLILVYLDGVLLQSGSGNDYTVSGNNILMDGTNYPIGLVVGQKVRIVE